MSESFYKELKNWVCTNNRLSNKSIPICGLWSLRCNFKPSILERKFNCKIIVAQTHGQGACYYEDKQISNKILNDLVGQNYEFDKIKNKVIDLSLLDSIASNFNYPYAANFLKNDNFANKSIWRAKIIVDEVKILAKKIKGKRKLKILNIGVVSLVLKQLNSENFIVEATDKDTTIINSVVDNKIRISDSIYNEELIKNSDIILITGMTLTTNSLDTIIDLCRKNNKILIIFAETGASFAPFYLYKGVSSIISEPFPFYTFSGYTQINTYRKDR